MTDIEKARREFLDECDVVVRSPMVSFLKGHEHTFTSWPISLRQYIYMGIKLGSRIKQVQIITSDGDTHLEKLLPNNMILLNPDDIYHKIITRDLVNLSIFDFVKTALLATPDADHIYDLLEKCKKAINEFGGYELKIWTEIPYNWFFSSYSITKLAFSSLVYSVINRLKSDEFYSLKRQYVQKLLKSGTADVPTLSPTGKNVNSNAGNVITNIFTTAFLLDSLVPTSGAMCFSSLFGNIRNAKEIDFSKHYCVIYEVPRYGKNRIYEDLLIGWHNTPRIQYKKKKIYPRFTNYIVEILKSGKFHATLSKSSSIHVDLVLINWRDLDHGLFGPILSPLFSDHFPLEISFNLYDSSMVQPDSTLQYFSYSNGLMQIVGSNTVIRRIVAELLRGQYTSIIYYDSTSMSIDDEGTILLDPNEYKLIEKNGIKKTEVPSGTPEKKIKIYIRDGQPGIEIDGKFMEMQESSFTYFALCAASKYKKEESLNFEELFLSARRQELTKLNGDLKDFKIRLRSKRGKIYFMDEKQRRILLDKNSLCTFKSEHYDWLIKNMDSFFEDMNQLKATENSTKKEQIEIIFHRYSILTTEGKKLCRCGYTVNSKLFAAIRNTELIKRAVEKLGWKFHDENWNQNWNLIKGKVSEMLKIIGCDFEELVN